MKQKSLLSIRQQYDRILAAWDRSKHRSSRAVFEIYSRYLVNIAAHEGLTIRYGSDYMPGVAAMIAFPKDYWRLPCETINQSAEFKTARSKEYPRSVYAGY